MKFFRRKQWRSVWADESRMALEYGGIWESDLMLQRFYRALNPFPSTQRVCNATRLPFQALYVSRRGFG